MTILKKAIDDLFDPTLTIEHAVDRHFAPGFRQRTNGQWDDRAGFLAHIALLRDRVAHAKVTVLDAHADGARYAQRHVIELLQRDGERIALEVYLFAERAPDGRFLRIEETTLKLNAVIDSA